MPKARGEGDAVERRRGAVPKGIEGCRRGYLTAKLWAGGPGDVFGQRRRDGLTRSRGLRVLTIAGHGKRLFLMGATRDGGADRRIRAGRGSEVRTGSLKGKNPRRVTAVGVGSPATARTDSLKEEGSEAGEAVRPGR
jgi:hypothetical protein